jgi:hypothetical protein
MNARPNIIFELPNEKEIESCAEEQCGLTPGLIKKTIRYRNGLTAVLFQDFSDTVFSIQLISNDSPFSLTRNLLVRRSNS